MLLSVNIYGPKRTTGFDVLFDDLQQLFDENCWIYKDQQLVDHLEPFIRAVNFCWDSLVMYPNLKDANVQYWSSVERAGVPTLFINISRH